jgi:hypothetical protein
LWPSPEQTNKFEQIKTLASKGGASLIAIGSSAVDAAFDPSRLSPASVPTRPAYNAGTGAASLTITTGWSEFEAIPRLKPDVVVLGVTSRELNPNDPEQPTFTRDFLTSRGFKFVRGNESTMQTVERRLENASALFRYRTILRQPQYAESLLGIGEVPRDDSYRTKANGQRASYLAGHFDDTPLDAMKKHFSSTALYKWKIGRGEQQTLSRLLKYLRAHVKHVLVVGMPVTPLYVEWSPGGQSDIDAFNAELQRQADGNGAQFLDGGVWPTEYFADAGHVNAQGAARFTATLNAELQRLGWR